MKYSILFCLFLCSIAGCATDREVSDYHIGRTKLALQVIEDSRNSAESITLAISELSDSELTSNVLVAHANNSTYSSRTHAVFVSELFRRYVRPRMTLAEIANTVGPAQWLKEEDIVRVMNFSGSLPVRASGSDVCYTLHVLPNSQDDVRIHLVFERELEGRELFLALSGNASSNTLHNVIRDVGISPYPILNIISHSPGR